MGLGAHDVPVIVRIAGEQEARSGLALAVAAGRVLHPLDHAPVVTEREGPVGSHQERTTPNVHQGRREAQEGAPVGVLADQEAGERRHPEVRVAGLHGGGQWRCRRAGRPEQHDHDRRAEPEEDGGDEGDPAPARCPALGGRRGHALTIGQSAAPPAFGQGRFELAEQTVDAQAFGSKQNWTWLMP